MDLMVFVKGSSISSLIFVVDASSIKVEKGKLNGYLSGFHIEISHINIAHLYLPTIVDKIIIGNMDVKQLEIVKMIILGLSLCQS